MIKNKLDAITLTQLHLMAREPNTLDGFLAKCVVELSIQISILSDEVNKKDPQRGSLSFRANPEEKGVKRRVTTKKPLHY